MKKKNPLEQKKTVPRAYDTVQQTGQAGGDNACWVLLCIPGLQPPLPHPTGTAAAHVLGDGSFSARHCLFWPKHTSCSIGPVRQRMLLICRTGDRSLWAGQGLFWPHHTSCSIGPVRQRMLLICRTGDRSFWAGQGLFWPQHTSFCRGCGQSRGGKLRSAIYNSIFAWELLRFVMENRAIGLIGWL
ncbi:unnamed protein product [Laminaria digitata]